MATTDTDTKVPVWSAARQRRPSSANGNRALGPSRRLASESGTHVPHSIEGWLAYVEHDDALMLYNGTAWTFDFKLAGVPHFAGTNTTGSGSASLGANCPAATPSAPYTWIQVKTADGSTAYLPVWK